MGTKTGEGNRWYDAHPKLRACLERFREMGPSKRTPVIKGAMTLIKENAPDLFDQAVLDFPLDMLRRRWYDLDPYLWLLFNGLALAEKPLLTQVTRFLESATAPKKKSPAHRTKAKK